MIKDIRRLKSILVRLVKWESILCTPRGILNFEYLVIFQTQPSFQVNKMSIHMFQQMPATCRGSQLPAETKQNLKSSKIIKQHLRWSLIIKKHGKWSKILKRMFTWHFTQIFYSLELRRWEGGIPNTSPHNERLIMCANPKYVFYAQHMSSLDGRGEDSGGQIWRDRRAGRAVMGFRVGG